MPDTHGGAAAGLSTEEESLAEEENLPAQGIYARAHSACRCTDLASNFHSSNGSNERTISQEKLLGDAGGLE